MVLVNNNPGTKCIYDYSFHFSSQLSKGKVYHHLFIYTTNWCGKKIIWVWNDMRVSKWQHFSFCMHYWFKNTCGLINRTLIFWQSRFTLCPPVLLLFSSWCSSVPPVHRDGPVLQDSTPVSPCPAIGQKWAILLQRGKKLGSHPTKCHWGHAWPAGGRDSGANGAHSSIWGFWREGWRRNSECLGNQKDCFLLPLFCYLTFETPRCGSLQSVMFVCH